MHRANGHYALNNRHITNAAAVWNARCLSRFVFLNLDLDRDLNLEKQDQEYVLKKLWQRK